VLQQNLVCSGSRLGVLLGLQTTESFKQHRREDKRPAADHQHRDTRGSDNLIADGTDLNCAHGAQIGALRAASGQPSRHGDQFLPAHRPADGLHHRSVQPAKRTANFGRRSADLLYAPLPAGGKIFG
jgi:hypothetical protein